MASNKKVSIDEFENAFLLILEDYERELNDEFKKDLRATAKTVVEEVKKTPSGAERYHDWNSYLDGWKMKTEQTHYGEYKHVIYNKDKPFLTHLLEKGHVNRDGSFARAFPHVEPAAEKGAEELKKRISGNGTK